MMRRVLLVFASIVGAYLIVRAVAEPFAIDMTDPATYAQDWGGPSLAGVLAVHSGPGLVAAALMVAYVIRRRADSRRSPGSDGS
jgi:hypothetical protein